MSRSLFARLRWPLFWLAIALFFSARAAQRSPEAEPRGAVWLDALGWYVPAFLLWAAAAALVVRLCRRYPLDGERRADLYLHAAASVALAVGHLLLFWLLMTGLNRAFGTSRFESDLEPALAILFHQNYLAYWLVVFGSRALAYARSVREQQIAAARLQQQLAEARLAALRMQLHPHFLFNTLNSIAELLHVDLGAAEQMVRRLASLLRTAIETATDHVVALGDEIDFLSRYLDVEKMRFQERLTVRFEIPPEVRAARVPALVLQPLVENAIRHGVGRMARGGEIVVRAALHDGLLLLEVENDMAAAAAPGAGAHLGVGLRNTSARLEQIYGGAAQLSTGPLPGTRRFLARLELPWIGARPARAAAGGWSSGNGLAEAPA
ncbi:MAG: histidine kinase [Thermoanaerobaculia bacterium]|nr:histidine kinase [Thermoanaerobaculia bacterium]